MAKLTAVPDEEEPGQSSAELPDRPGKPRGRRVTSLALPEYWREKVEGEAKREGISNTQVFLRGLQSYFERAESRSWDALDDDDYDEAAFYTRTQDKKGHSASFRITVPSHLGGELRNLVQSGALPAYRSAEDVFRDALVHRMKRIAAMLEDGSLSQAVDIAMLISDELELIYQADSAEELIARVDENFRRIVAEHDGPARAKVYLAGRRDHADSLAEPYRSAYLDRIDVLEDAIPAPSSPRRRKRKR